MGNMLLLLSISSHFSTRGSQVRCELANYVSKFRYWARTSQQSSQVCFNVMNFICKQMFILNNNNQFNETQTFLVALAPLDQKLSIELLIST